MEEDIIPAAFQRYRRLVRAMIAEDIRHLPPSQKVIGRQIAALSGQRWLETELTQPGPSLVCLAFADTQADGEEIKERRTKKLAWPPSHNRPD